MKILFAGSPSAAVPTLKALCESEHEVVGVLTQPPKPFARTKALKGTPVLEFAMERNIPVSTPLTPAGVAQCASNSTADLAVVVAYGQILSSEAISALPGGWWNVHFSRLPEWRGAAPVQHAILSGATHTGLSIFRIVQELDAGPLAANVGHAVDPNDTSGTLLGKLAMRAPELVLNFLSEGNPDDGVLEAQEGTPSLAPKFPSGFGKLDLTQTGATVYRHFRAVSPEPGAFVHRADTGAVVKILDAWMALDYDNVEPGEIRKAPKGILLGTADTPLILNRVHPAGKKPMNADDWARGLPDGARISVEHP